VSLRNEILAIAREAVREEISGPVTPERIYSDLREYVAGISTADDAMAAGVLFAQIERLRIDAFGEVQPDTTSPAEPGLQE